MFFYLFAIVRTITFYPAKYLKLICSQIIRGVVEIFIGIVVTNFKFICMKDKFFIIRNIYSAYLCMEFLCITTCGNFAERELFLVCCSFLLIWPSNEQNNIFMSVMSDGKNLIQLFTKIEINLICCSWTLWMSLLDQ